MGRLIDADAMEKDLREQYLKVFVEAGRKVKPEDYFIERNAVYNADRIKAELDSFFEYLASRPAIDPVKYGYVHKEVLDQIRWERDIAMSYLEEAGIGFGEKAELQRVKHGKWIEKYGTWYCSECDKTGYKGYIPAKPSDYCPNCGADMRGE